MKKELLPFQRVGAEFLANNYHAIMGDDMGLGKTVQALAACELRDLRRVAVVCPASVRSNWKREIVECGLDASRFIIDSYNAAANKKFPAGAYDGIILDEAHFCKTPESQRTQAIFGDGGLARSATFKWPMSGTMIMNRPSEMYPVLATLFKDKLGQYASWSSFTQHFCGAFWEGPGRGMNTRGASNLAELSRILSGVMIRRLADDPAIGLQLPPALVRPMPIELPRAELDKLLELESEISNRDMYLSPTLEDFSQLGDTSRMRKALGLAKVQPVADFIDDLIDAGHEKVVVFYKHTEVARQLDQALGHQCPVTYKGGMTDDAKDAAKRDFMTSKDCCCFLGQIQAAGTGLDGLQKVARTIVFAEQEWSPEEIQQNIRRLRRMGMDMSRPVNVYMPLVEGTLESAMMGVQLNKAHTIHACYRQVERASSLVRPVGPECCMMSPETLSLMEGLI